MTDCERCCICGKIDGEDLRVQPGKVIIAGYCEEHDPSAELAKLRALCESIKANSERISRFCDDAAGRGEEMK